MEETWLRPAERPGGADPDFVFKETDCRDLWPGRLDAGYLRSGEAHRIGKDYSVERRNPGIRGDCAIARAVIDSGTLDRSDGDPDQQRSVKGGCDPERGDSREPNIAERAAASESRQF